MHNCNRYPREQSTNRTQKPFASTLFCLEAFTHPGKGNHYLGFYYHKLAVPAFNLNIKGTIQHVLFCVWLLCSELCL